MQFNWNGFFNKIFIIIWFETIAHISVRIFTLNEMKLALRCDNRILRSFGCWTAFDIHVKLIENGENGESVQNWNKRKMRKANSTRGKKYSEIDCAIPHSQWLPYGYRTSAIDSSAETLKIAVEKTAIKYAPSPYQLMRPI